jgi:hypothetical protein
VLADHSTTTLSTPSRALNSLFTHTNSNQRYGSREEKHRKSLHRMSLRICSTISHLVPFMTLSARSSVHRTPTVRNNFRF